LNIEAIVVELRGERDRIDKAISALEGTFSKVAGSGVKHHKASAGKRKRGRLSAAGRKRISEMMKKRWAERRKKAAAKKQ
jgi:hypothetical protein